MAKADTIDEELVVGLKTAKTKRCYFALVVKGSNEGALIISKQKVPPVAVAAAKKKCGGSAVIKGAVSYEDGKYIFETGKPPAATLPNTLKLIAKRDTGIAIVAVCRLSTDPEVLADDGAPAGSAPVANASPAAIPAAPPAPPAPGKTAAPTAEARFMARFKALFPLYKQALNSNPQRKASLEQLLKAATVASQKRLFDQGMIVLDRLETAIRAAPTPAARAASAGQNGQAEFTNRFNALTPNLKRALAARSPVSGALKQWVDVAQTLAKNGDFPKAQRGLDKIESLIGQALQGAAASPAGAGEFQARWKPARQAWQTASAAVDQQIGQLQQALLKSGDDELKGIAQFGLNGVTGNFKVPLMAAMREMDGCSPEDLKPTAAKLRAVASKFQQHLSSEDTVAACDENPFGVTVTIRKLLVPALAEIQKALDAAGAS